MPYFIDNNNDDCNGYAVVKENGEIIGCHENLENAIDQMVAISLEENIEPGGYLNNDDKNIENNINIKQYKPPQGAINEAKKGLEWRREYNRGGTEIGVARARDISNGRNLSDDTIGRMVSYFARHEVDKNAEGFKPGEDGFPSNGRIAWALWGGDPGQIWANKIWRQIQNEKSKNNSTHNNMKEEKMKIKTFTASVEVKNDKDENAPFGSFSALVSIFNNTDLVGDRVMPGAFKKSLESYEKENKIIPIVWNHDFGTAESFIGKTLNAEETDEGLLIKGAFFDTPRAQMVRTLLNERVVTQFSFAYDTIDEQKGEDGVNELRELHILEASVTLKGANPATQLIEAKNINIEKAEPNELSEGSFVIWENDGYGRVEYIMTEGFFGVDNDPLSLEATAEDPLALVRLYEEDMDDVYQPTGLFIGLRFSQLSLTEEKVYNEDEDEDEDDKKSTFDNLNIVKLKAGRTLSNKNENSIREAKALLDGVLSSLDSPNDVVKNEEQINAKFKEPAMDADVAKFLLDIYNIDKNL